MINKGIGKNYTGFYKIISVYPLDPTWWYIVDKITHGPIGKGLYYHWHNKKGDCLSALVCNDTDGNPLPEGPYNFRDVTDMVLCVVNRTIQ